MEHKYATTVLQPVCPDCGCRLDALASMPVDLDWRDERERVLGQNAMAVQLHRVTAHPATPKCGDVVVYYAPWRGLILGTGPLIVRDIHEHDLNAYARSMGADLDVQIGVKFHLVNPSRESDGYWPSTGDIRYPITFDVLTEYVAPAVEHDLFDLLGGEWAELGV